MDISMNVVRLSAPLSLVLLGNAPRLRESAYGIMFRILGFLSLSMNVRGDDLFSDMLVLTSVLIGVALAAYTTRYSGLKYGNLNLVILVDLFLVAMTLVFASETLIELITFWLMTELIGFLLVAYDYISLNDSKALSAAVKYLLFSMIPTDVALFVLLALTGFSEAFTTPLRNITPLITNPLVLTMILLGFFSKVAIFPLHFWLPDAHSVAPSPASALLSGLMVKMGVYALYVMCFYPIDRGLAVSIMLFSGLLSVIYGALQASIQHDIKRLLAYSTTSDTALMTVLTALYMSSGDKLFVEALILYVTAHAIYKSTMFMDSGFIELLTHERDVTKLGQVWRVSPLETVAVFVNILAMLGMPPAIGFLAKVFMFTSISHYLEYSWVYVIVLLLASVKVALFITYNTVYLKAHIRGDDSSHELSVDKRALKVLPFVITSSLLSFLVTALLYVLDCSGYVELLLLRKLVPLMVASLVIFIASSYSLLGYFKQRIMWSERGRD